MIHVIFYNNTNEMYSHLCIDISMTDREILSFS